VSCVGHTVKKSDGRPTFGCLGNARKITGFQKAESMQRLAMHDWGVLHGTRRAREGIYSEKFQPILSHQGTSRKVHT
jgi:hypothetical protein